VTATELAGAYCFDLYSDAEMVSRCADEPKRAAIREFMAALTARSIGPEHSPMSMEEILEAFAERAAADPAAVERRERALAITSTGAP
jgi:hypothetical protein